MIILRDDELIVRIDPHHGGEILDLLDCATGRQLLGRPPFAAVPPTADFLDESAWTAAYRGGWQLLAPNAGNACTVAGELHGFHGAASSEAWTVIGAGPASAALEWRGHGLRIVRTMAIADGALALETTFETLAERVPFVAVEHCALGIDVLDPCFEIHLEGGSAYELSETSGPVRVPANAAAWPEIALLDGGRERGDRAMLSDVRGRFLVVAQLAAGRADIINRELAVGLTLEWDAALLPHVWIWHEARLSGGVWRQHGEILAVEPASVPHSLGLAAAIENDQAHWVEPGRPVCLRMTARPWRPGAGEL